MGAPRLGLTQSLMQFFSRLVIRPEKPLAEDFVAVGGRALRETASANYRTLPLLLPAPRADDQIPLLFATCGLHSEKNVTRGFWCGARFWCVYPAFPESPSFGGIGIPGHDRMDNLLKVHSYSLLRSATPASAKVAIPL